MLALVFAALIGQLRANSIVVYNNNIAGSPAMAAPAEATSATVVSELQTVLQEKNSTLVSNTAAFTAARVRAEARDAEIANLVAYFRRQRAPIATEAYAAQFIDLSRANGADYKVVVAISGIESGFCIAPYKKFNCFGYLNGVQYSSFSQALATLIPKVSREYARKYGTNFEAIAKAYGMRNVEYQSQKMRTIYNAI